MKTVLITLGLSAVFFGIGLLATRVVVPRVMAHRAAEAAADSAAEAADLAPLAEAVENVDARLEAAQEQADSLRHVVDGHEAEYADAEADAAALATTLTRLEDDALGAIVQRLDGHSFTKLYDAATPRNRSRLLDALTPDQAASFIRHRLPGSGPPPVMPASAPPAAAARPASGSTAPSAPPSETTAGTEPSPAP